MHCHLAGQQRLAAKYEAAQREAQRRAEAERKLFVTTAGPVQLLRQPARVLLAPEQPPPIPMQQQLDLHGLRREDAREALSAFIRETHRRGPAARADEGGTGAVMVLLKPLS